MKAHLAVNMSTTFLEFSWYFSRMHMYMIYIVVKFQTLSYNTFQDIYFFIVNF